MSQVLAVSNHFDVIIVRAVYVLVAYEFNHSSSVCEIDKTMWLELDITWGIHNRHDLSIIRLHSRPREARHEVKIHFMVTLKCLILTRSTTPVYLTQCDCEDKICTCP